ncbi:MAG TPA: lipopolysaccharide kinase InaA family protein [Candidatus Dormibacteraeota bacterium]|nr:lipopolysaccharide kinase InaA family protein [Candidatus Dormibacteraeota bacterium]
MNWRVMGLEGVPLRRGGWIFFLLDYDARFSEELRESLIDSAFEAIDGTLKKRIRRSRHAETWAQHLGSGGGPDVYFKVIDAAHGAHAMKLLFKGSRVAHVARISERLRADGIGVPEILLLGAEQRGGREIVVTARVEGRNVPRYLRSEREPLTAKRATLRALGAEIARLHRAGYLHGDLTPYNIFVTGVDPPQFVFIDHDRTRRTILSRFERPRMRNLVQLGHLDLKTITNTDRMRVWCGYSATMPTRGRRAARRRVVQMLQTRIARDRDNNLTQSADAVVPGSMEVREG